MKYASNHYTFLSQTVKVAGTHDRYICVTRPKLSRTQLVTFANCILLYSVCILTDDSYSGTPT